MILSDVFIDGRKESNSGFLEMCMIHPGVRHNVYAMMTQDIGLRIARIGLGAVKLLLFWYLTHAQVVEPMWIIVFWYEMKSPRIVMRYGNRRAIFESDFPTELCAIISESCMSTRLIWIPWVEGFFRWWEVDSKQMINNRIMVIMIKKCRQDSEPWHSKTWFKLYPKIFCTRTMLLIICRTLKG
jgi:hypothetical protein